MTNPAIHESTNPSIHQSNNPSIHPTARRLIVNADDFGRSSSINAAVIRAHREGILTSASLMVNEPAFAEAVALARQNPPPPPAAGPPPPPPASGSTTRRSLSPCPSPARPRASANAGSLTMRLALVR